MRRSVRSVLVVGWSELDETPERELGLHDDRPAAVQTANADRIETGQPQHGGRVALLVDAVAGRRTLVPSRVHLLRGHTLDALIVTDVNTKRPSSRQVVIDQLTQTQTIHPEDVFTSAIFSALNALQELCDHILHVYKFILTMTWTSALLYHTNNRQNHCDHVVDDSSQSDIGFSTRLLYDII